MMNQSEQSHGMIRYTSRDYNSIMEEFWNMVPKLTELWKPEADSDPGVVLGKFLASIADMLGVNLDWLANEIFGPSVSQRKNAEKLFGLIGYNLGWYTAARTEVTFTNTGASDMELDFGFNGSNFCTLNAYTDITAQPRVITYNILPMTNKYGVKDARSKRVIVSEGTNIFATADPKLLKPGESVTRVAIEGELRSITKTVAEVKANNYIIKLPSQHIDTTAVWIKAKSSFSTVESTQWIQVASAAEFVEPEPRFAVTYDNYSNAQIQVSNYLNELENYSDAILNIYWIECSGVIGSVSADVLGNYQPANVDSNHFDSEALTISNLANTVELPHSYTVTGRSPETAKEAYYNSRKYINTWDSLITVPDFNRFLLREAGVDCGLVIDCQKALEINMAIYYDDSLTESQKNKMYLTDNDFPLNVTDYFNWREIIELKEDDIKKNRKIPFTCNFRTYTAMCYLIHNDFSNSADYAPTEMNDINSNNTKTEYKNQVAYIQYKAPYTFLDAINADFRPLQAMSVELDFGYVRVFPWFVVGQIYPKKMVSKDKAANIVAKVREALALYFAPANRALGQKPTVMEVVEVVENAHSEIRYFDAGSLTNPIINYGQLRTIGNSTTEIIQKFDIEYFNPISFARYQDLGAGKDNIRIAPEWILKE